MKDDILDSLPAGAADILGKELHSTRHKRARAKLTDVQKEGLDLLNTLPDAVREVLAKDLYMDAEDMRERRRSLKRLRKKGI